MKTMLLRLLTAILIILALLSGCAVPIEAAKPELDDDALNQLVSQPRDLVFEILGAPDKQFEINSRHYLIYITISETRDLAFFYEGNKASLGCLLIELDQNNLVLNHKFKNAMTWISSRGIYERVCLKRFWSTKTLKAHYLW